MATRVLIILLVLTGVANAQPAKLTVGIYAPSVDFGTAQARLAYVQGLAKSIEQNTGIPTVGDSYASLAALKKAAPDFAIIEANCYATNSSLGKVLAIAQIGGSTSRTWALFASGANSMQELKGKKLAFMAAGCNDTGFVDNAMLDSEVDDKFFGARVGEKDVTGAVASVSSYKTAQAVFAPVTMSKGLTKLFETGNVPNPAFVQINSNIPSNIESKVASAVRGYGGGGAISGWAGGDSGPYRSLYSQMQPVRKSGLFAQPEGVRLDSKDVLVDPPTLKDTGDIIVRHHFYRPNTNRLD